MKGCAHTVWYLIPGLKVKKSTLSWVLLAQNSVDKKVQYLKLLGPAINLPF